MVQNAKGEIVLDRSEFALLIENDDVPAPDTSGLKRPDDMDEFMRRVCADLRDKRRKRKAAAASA